jgi:hypothetical protein
MKEKSFHRQIILFNTYISFNEVLNSIGLYLQVWPSGPQFVISI